MLISIVQIMTKNYNRKKRKKKNENKTHSDLHGSTLSLHPLAKTKKNFHYY